MKKGTNTGTGIGTLTFDREIISFNPFAFSKILGVGDNVKTIITGNIVTITGIGEIDNQLISVETAAKNLIKFLDDEIGNECIKEEY